MSTNDVPGKNLSNNDSLSMGCWAEHEDGSHILVHANENGRVIYSIFDFAHDVEYRDAMPEDDFKSAFTWKAVKNGKIKNVPDIKWTWHDKTAFPWDRVIKLGAKDGTRPFSAADVLSAAEKVAKSLSLRAQKIDPADLAQRQPTQKGVAGLMRDIADAIERNFGAGA